MRKPRQKSKDWAEQALVDWAAWVQSSLDAQGWGGGADRDILTSMVHGRPQYGWHSDPVLAELIATLADGQAQNQRVHRHLVRYSREISRDWFRVVWARFVGELEVKATRATTWSGIVQVGRSTHWPIELPGVIVVSWKWSGLQTYDQVVQQTGIKLRTAEAMVSQVKRLLEQDLRMDKRVRSGGLLHDGPANFGERQKLEEMERARQEETEELRRAA